MDIKKSNFDLHGDIKSHLIALLSETKNFVHTYQYAECDLFNAEIEYIRHRQDLTIGINDGFETLHTMQKYNIQPQNKLRSGTKNYRKKHYLNGSLKKIESFVDGSLDVYFWAAYNNSKRYLIPFSKPHVLYPTYTHVWNECEDIIEEYMVDNNQIVYYRYKKTSENTYDFLYINYIPNGTYPVNCIETGTFEISDKITYTEKQHYDWYMEFDAYRKNLPFTAPEIPMLNQNL